ncbi:MAG: hypothetical protein JW991_00875 [Candidatus Pacebacteria bacterium]|nr:hypothetical protein [Candidatus Paceibacterota bacterium]
MKGIKAANLIKLLLILVLLGGFVFSGKNIYDRLSQAFRVNPVLVEANRPYLDVDSVKRAARALGYSSE